MRFILVIQLFFSIYKIFGQGFSSEDDTLDKSALFPSTTSSKQFNVLRDILNQESLVRFSMVQKIQTLVMDAIESKNLSKTLEIRLGHVVKELGALKINDDKMKEEIAKLKAKLDVEYRGGKIIIEDSNSQSYNYSESVLLRGNITVLQKEIRVLSFENEDVKEQLYVLKNKELESLKNETFDLYQKYDEISKEIHAFKNKSEFYERRITNFNNQQLLIEKEIQNLSVSFNEAIENIRQNAAAIQELKGSKNATVCEKGWVSFNGNCYFFSSTKMNFHDAATFCTNAASGSSLLEDQSPHEEKWILIQFRLRGLHKIWIGVSDIFEETKFVRMSDAEVVTDIKWAKGQPDNYNNNENCLEIYSNGEWNDRNCDERNGFICKLNGR
ncbi:C-type lectin domain family 4 member M-like [Saccostrea cucullata]|uniref:C-type lectin domain family 4 member M-like n=1 Tax=Saccostrea cuccullata TaxID=36930 RepID=UPI002ED1B5FE